ncbi:MAG TPA: ABC transporter substrate-binding protein [Moraxellaceae bacterium]|nr:ABC transporter substrate-binding protein [Moraxellaceae bacterium]
MALTPRRAAWLPGLFLLLLSLPAAALRLEGADGVAVELPGPARRIVTLAPHLGDGLLALGARAQVAGVIDDHPQRGAHARSLSGLPVVGDAAGLNYEAVLALRPDLVLAWGGGTPQAWIDRLRALRLPVLVLESRRLDELAGETEQLGRLAGREAAAAALAATQRAQLARLGAPAEGPRLRFFYQAWRQPLYSLDGNHLLSQALARCGADNILPAGPVPAPLVSPEFVLRADPDILFFGESDAAASRAYWARFPGLAAVREARLLALGDPRLTRPGPAMLSAMEPVCSQIRIWRKRKGMKPR